MARLSPSDAVAATLGEAGAGEPQPVWAPERLVPENLPVRRPRLLLDMTGTLRSGKNTGIQRVVREIARNGWMMGEGIPVAIHDGEVRACYWAPGFAETLEIEAGDIFLMLDTVWNHLDEYLPLLDEMRRRGASLIVCLHDILPITYPDAFPPELVERFARWVSEVVLKSDGVIANSQSTAESLRNYLADGGPSTPTLPIGWWRLGDDFSCDGGGDASPLADRIAYGGKPYFLGVGTIEPRKGYPVVLDAMETLWAEGVDAAYVIVGSKGWGMSQFERRIERHVELDRRLFWLSNASDADLTLLYRNARAMILASFAEGFGLPIVEAAHYRTPVIATDIPVFREAAGDSARYFRLLDSDSLSRAIRAAFEEKLRAPALTPVSWRDSATQLLDMARNRDFQMTQAFHEPARRRWAQNG